MKRLVFSLVAALALSACGSSDDALPAHEARGELVDRNWLDTWPQDADEQLHVYRFTPSMGGGVFQDRTLFEGRFELFTFEATGETITYTFPGRDETHETEYRIEPVDGPHPFTHRLVLDDDPRGPGTYYGWDERRTAAPFRQ